MKTQIRHYRQVMELSQARLAKLAGISQATIAHIEKRGKAPSLVMLSKIAKALQVPPKELLCD
jgi:transcriptional regulator with XRE-family HTH domain